MVDERIEGAGFGIGSDVQLIDDEVAQRDALPAVIIPGKIPVDYLGWAVHALWLEPRRRVGPFFDSIQKIKISALRCDSLGAGIVVADIVFLERKAFAARRDALNLDPFDSRRPGAKLASIRAKVSRAWTARSRRIHHPSLELFKNSTDNGGTVSVREWGRPCSVTGLASTPPRLP